MDIHEYVARHREKLFRLKTPCYVFFARHLDAHLERVSRALSPLASWIYSIKANPHPEVVRSVGERVSGFDVSSLGEARRVHEVFGDARAKQVSFVGPGKTREDCARFLELFSRGVIVVESVEELLELLDDGSGIPGRVRVCLRVDLAEKVAPGGRVSAQALQFGLSEAEAHDSIALARRSDRVELEGFHFHSFSQHLDYRSLIAHFRAAGRFMQTVRSGGFAARLVNLGSGIGIPYFDGAGAFDWEGFLREFAAVADDLRSTLAPDGTICLESGRYLVGGSGIFLTRVIRRKARGAGSYLILDGGFAQNSMITGTHLPLRKNFKHHVLIRGALSDPRKEYSAFGPSCSVNDIVFQNSVLPEVGPGDIVWFENMGAYGKTFSPCRFLSFEDPGEHLL